MSLLIQVSPDVHIKCKDINRSAFPKVLVQFQLHCSIEIAENEMSMTKSPDSVNRGLYYGIIGTLRLILKLSLQEKVYKGDAQTS